MNGENNCTATEHSKDDCEKKRSCDCGELLKYERFVTAPTLSVSCRNKQINKDTLVNLDSLYIFKAGFFTCFEVYCSGVNACKGLMARKKIKTFSSVGSKKNGHKLRKIRVTEVSKIKVLFCKPPNPNRFGVTIDHASRLCRKSDFHQG